MAMANMMGHRNKPYSCGCCSPYWDKKNGSRAYDERRWRTEYEDDMSDHSTFRISGNQPGAPPGGTHEQDRQDEAFLGETDARRPGREGVARPR